MKGLLTVTCLTLLLCLHGKDGCAKTFRISPGANSIHNAISSAHKGDTIYVQAGVYKEHDITITSGITIIGIGYPVIDAENKYQGFIVSADSVTFEGLQIQNTGRASTTDIAGIKLINAHYVTIRKNKLLNNTYGVYLQNVSHCFVLNNIILSNSTNEINNGNGVHAWKSDNLLVKGNTCSGQRDGIYFEFVTDSHIEDNNSFSNVRYGLHFMFSHDDTYTHNTFKDNGAGVAVMYSHGVIMQDNDFLHNWGDAAYGLLLKEITDSKIEHNRFIKNTVGIYMEGTTRVDVKHCLFEDNGWALRVQASCSGSNFVAL
jgi:nitrous oxidase accessory protein